MGQEFPGRIWRDVVSQVVPTAQIVSGCLTLGSPEHSWIWMAQETSNYAVRGMFYAADVLGNTAINVLRNTALLNEAKQAFATNMAERKYVWPIPPEVKPHGYTVC